MGKNIAIKFPEIHSKLLSGKDLNCSVFVLITMYSTDYLLYFYIVCSQTWAMEFMYI
jgi:hypothetical protein